VHVDVFRTYFHRPDRIVSTLASKNIVTVSGVLRGGFVGFNPPPPQKPKGPPKTAQTQPPLKKIYPQGGSGGGGFGGYPPPPPKVWRPSKIVPNSTQLWKLLKIAEFRTPTPQDVQKKGCKILKLLLVRNCFALAMTNKLVVIINSL